MTCVIISYNLNKHIMQAVHQYHEGDNMFKIMFFESLSPEITEIMRMVLNPETASLCRIESNAYMTWLYRAKNHNSDPEHRERDNEPSLSERNKNYRAVPKCREERTLTHRWQNNPERGWHTNESGTKPNIHENRRMWRSRAQSYQHPMPRHTQGQNYTHRWQGNNPKKMWHTDWRSTGPNIYINRRMWGSRAEPYQYPMRRHRGGQTRFAHFRPIPPPTVPGGNRETDNKEKLNASSTNSNNVVENANTAPVIDSRKNMTAAKCDRTVDNRQRRQREGPDRARKTAQHVAGSRDGGAGRWSTETRPEECRRQHFNGGYSNDTKMNVNRSAEIEEVNIQTYRELCRNPAHSRARRGRHHGAQN
ncbi:uncharacterized protein LOC133361285 [Lethenteron reissneri]|uniref:uncharacterized protein LOC133361285 n=1 Tax=Lethenteron reissneri TaxID=7753 RepID=UPI002AB6C511|nr:uncharacterized protein LOC133361285 [Lethenteron reissneri]